MEIRRPWFEGISRLDMAVAAIFTFIAVMGTFHITEGDGVETTRQVAAIGCCLVAGGALLVRRLWPLAVLAIVGLAAATYAALGVAGGPIYFSMLVAAFTIGTARSRLTSLVLVGAVVGVISIGVFAGNGFDFDDWQFLPFFLGWTAAAVFMGDAIQNRRSYAESARQQARQAELTREEEGLRRLAEERVNIARDLHDIIAHSLATITVQAGAGAHVIERDPEKAREALNNIRETSRQALQDLRATLSSLRGEGEAAPHQPTPGLADLPMLAETVRRTGLDVRIETEGDGYSLPQSVDVVAYRIVQESLTNVVRHAQASRVLIRLEYEAASLVLEVIDDGRGEAAQTGAAGHGIMGMSERAASVGGTLEAGPVDGGGFRVWARLPRGNADPSAS